MGLDHVRETQGQQDPQRCPFQNRLVLEENSNRESGQWHEPVACISASHAKLDPCSTKYDLVLNQADAALKLHKYIRDSIASSSFACELC